MKRIFIAILFFVLGIGIAQAIVPVDTNHASDTVVTVKNDTAFQQVADLVSPDVAEAAVGGVYVVNFSTRDIKIACNYNGALKTLAPNQDSQDSGKCTADNGDTDQVLVTTTVCVKFVGPKKADGWYRLAPGTRRKIPDLSSFAVRNLSYCDGKSPYHGYWTYT